MANGKATITFDEVDLDNCIKQGLELIGSAKCKNCKQKYSFRIHLNLQKKKHKYEDVVIKGKTVTVLVPDTYNVSIEFSGNHDLTEGLDLLEDDEEEAEALKPCVPCSRCTPNCPRLRRK
ncbi:MAG: hypothetical protein JXA41_10665 [Deltaproteobacteria bacterium]|nr:hypothetical protein [Deltaproteobacteria bacterium]